MTTNKGFFVEKPGMLSLIQDMGRFGSFNVGLTNGGPIDLNAFQWANRLCANPLHATAIEITFGGLVITAQVETTIAIAGANMPIKLNGLMKEMWRSFSVKAGDVIELGYAKEGVRSYLAVAGGFNIIEMFGSTSTVCREGIGGLSGDKLKVGDILPTTILPTSKKVSKTNLTLPESLRPIYSNNVVLNTVPSYQYKSFSSVQQRLFFSSQYTVSKHNNRMGYRLSGKKIVCDIEGILSEGICHGAVQIPADGQPIVLMNDRQTIGGYPKIGAVSSVDTSKLGQLKQGDKVRFEPISMEQAHNYFHMNLSRFKHSNPRHCD